MKRLLTDEEVRTLQHLIKQILPAGTLWTLLMIPRHECDGHCPVNTIANVSGEDTKRLVAAAFSMLMGGIYEVDVVSTRGGN